ncbi:RNA polymerase sigma-70 factor [Amycolatopsis suaedae]|uniref:RNA polymerase sigma-70 factor n=1 Tax=Amycolatopsis suaedae TaxID=2510978 RepID=A0A4Q7IY89_9PSEU|nr:RNA polymerase sigma-70 factor [Amycolatopsis suaedae]RZQ59930.1 RNA polymerase sigma-70 factor [Amycolatopsis suaedae]
MSVTEFEEQRPRLFGLAYRLLGSAAEAEDVVQDAYLRWSESDRSVIRTPSAWLAKVVTNLSLTRLTSARARRETYVGPWLPEPVYTGDGALGPLEDAEQRESVSIALLYLLERLTPTERAVFVLREAFGYSHREIAGIVDLSEANSRQLHSRARQHLADARPRYEPDPGDGRELLARFLAAARDGDLAGLERMLAQDVVLRSDGGGKVTAARKPVAGRDKVARLFAGGFAGLGPVELAFVEVNGTAAVVGRAGKYAGMLTLTVSGGRITELYAIANPDKLAHLQATVTSTGAVQF